MGRSLGQVDNAVKNHVIPIIDKELKMFPCKFGKNSFVKPKDSNIFIRPDYDSDVAITAMFDQITKLHRIFQGMEVL